MVADSRMKLHVILLEPEIAANTGSIGRTCVAAGAMLWLVRPLGFRLDDRYLRRAGLDYWPHLNYRVIDGLDEVVMALGRDRIWSFSTKAKRVYTDAAYQPGDALLFGPEARSLNLANAVAIAVFEAVRQISVVRDR
jgi:tRNA (cytidine/uridine-2'-O-)-methyltransferase